MKRDRIFGLLCGLLLLLGPSAASAADQPTRDAHVSCEVAIPSDCAPSESKAGIPRTRLVKRIEASTEAACLERARATAATCISLAGVKPEITAKFRNGPVETIRQVTESAKPAIRHDAVRIPIVYGKNFETEIEQYGYSPRFAPGVVNFNNDGLMRIRHRNYLQSQKRDGQWTFMDFAAAAAQSIRRLADVTSFEWDNRFPNSDHRIYYDTRGWAYTLVQGGRTRLTSSKAVSHRPYLLVSQDDGVTWAAVALRVPDERPTWWTRMEHNDGNNDRSGPPPVLLFDHYWVPEKRSPRLYLYVPQWRGEELTMPPALLVSEKSLLPENHSGAANSLVSTVDRIYIVYPGSQPAPNMRGTPAYMAVFNKKKAAIEGEVLIGFGGTAAKVDNHNIPGVCIGTRQMIHVLLPGHHEALRFLSGKIVGGQLTAALDGAIGQAPTSAGGYTYGSLNCDRVGNVYVTSRWAGDGYRFQLVFLHRKPDGTWENWSGRAHKVLVDPGRTFYGAWRQKLTLDPKGGLFLSYGYYANQLTKDELAKIKWRFPFQTWTEVKELQPRMCVKGNDRCWLHPMPEVNGVVMQSLDSGITWRLVQ